MRSNIKQPLMENSNNQNFRSPLPDIVELQIVNKDVPCGEDFAHFTRVSFVIKSWKSSLLFLFKVYGATGDSSMGKRCQYVQYRKNVCRMDQA